MSNYANTKAVVAANVYTNNNNEVTAAMVKTAINDVIDTLIAGGYLFGGVAKPGDAATSPDANGFWLATEAGKYTNKGGLEVYDGEIAVLKYDGSWSKDVLVMGAILAQTLGDATSTGTGYYDGSGTRVPSNSFVNWRFSVNGAMSRIRCYVHITTSYPAVLFYGPGGFISAAYTTSGAAQWVDAAIPPGTTYLRVVSGASDQGIVDVQIYVSGSNIVQTFSSLGTSLADVDSRERDLLGALTATNDMSYVKRQLALEMGTISPSSGADSSSTTTVRAKGYIYVGDAFLLKVALANSYKARVFLYDGAQTFLGSYDWVTDPETVMRFNANFAGNTTVIIPSGQSQSYDTMSVKYVRVIFRDPTESSGVTPEDVADNCEVSTASITAHYANPRLKTNGLVLSLAHQGVGVRKGGNAWASNGNNMLSSVYGAYLAGHDGCLLNTVWTSDGVPVCNHDGYFTDAVSGVTVTIASVTYDQLQTHPFNASGECVPSLDSALYMCKSLGLKVWLVNMSITEEKIDTVYGLVSKYQMRDDVYWMTSAASAVFILARYRFSKLAVCQSNIASVDYSEIEGAIAVAESIVEANDRCTVTVWVSGSHPVENLIQAGGELPERTTLGTYNVSVADVPKVLPYVKVLSTHSMSVGGLNYQILDNLATQFPEMLAYYYGNELI